MDVSQEVLKILRRLINNNLSDLHLTKKRGRYQAHQFDGEAYDYFKSPKGLELDTLFQSLTELFRFDVFKPSVQDAKCVIRVDNKEVTLFGFFLPLIDGDRLELRMATIK
jgi:hypothetical protein